jgi:hypothetical protein
MATAYEARLTPEFIEALPQIVKDYISAKTKPVH